MQIRKSAEDYLEAILVLSKQGGGVRSIDIATMLGVSKPSVSHAMKLLREDGYIAMDRYGTVTLLDLSGKNIRQALEKAAEAGVKLDSCIHGDALRLSEYLYKEEQFDVVLLMGPLYHLLRSQDREKALWEALRVFCLLYTSDAADEL